MSHDDKTNALMDAARAAAGISVERRIAAWRKVMEAAVELPGPRRELGRLYRLAERWSALVEELNVERRGRRGR